MSSQARAPAALGTASRVVHRGIVKQVLSGDAIIVRGPPRGGPPPERTICMTNVTAPKLGRRANPNNDNSETPDEPYAWEAREFLRKKIIGKEVCFTVEYKAPGSSREYGVIYNGKTVDDENLTESAIANGFVEVKRQSLKISDEGQARLAQLEDSAKAAGVGRWNEDEKEKTEHVRHINWNVDNLRNFVDSHHGKPISAIIEHVRDGCTVRAFLLPSFHHVTIMMAGIKCPMFRMTGDQQAPEPLAEQARFFTESRLLQREVEVILEGVSNQNYLGTILHPNGKIAELLLDAGFARCVEWSMEVVTDGRDRYRACEMKAKSKKLGIWKDYVPADVVEIKDKDFTGKVVEIVNGDAMVIKEANGNMRKIFLSSVRAPRAAPSEGARSEGRPRSRPLYDVPYLFEAREFLRKRLIGKKVNVTIDYIQPPNQGFPEKVCCTVHSSGINVAEAVVSKGLAKVVRYREGDDDRSAFYEALDSAEERARKKGVGIHDRKPWTALRVSDVTGDKAKAFLPFLQRAGRCQALVEFVASGSRIRLYIPKETCMITFLLSGITCPRGSRTLPSGDQVAGEPFGEEAYQFTKDALLQRDVEVEVETMDKGGNFIGWLYIDGKNHSMSLVEHGLSQVHFSAERSSCYATLCSAQSAAKQNNLGLWKNYVEPVETEQVVLQDNGNDERKMSPIEVIVTEVSSDMTIYTQTTKIGAELGLFMDELRQELASHSPVAGAFVPRKGSLCVAVFSDGEWYRAKIEHTDKSNSLVLFIDYGNREEVPNTQLGALPAQFEKAPPYASSYQLAFISVPQDDDFKQDAVTAALDLLWNQTVNLNVEMSIGGVKYVTLQQDKKDLGLMLVEKGYLLVGIRKERRFSKIMSEYRKAQEVAKNARLNIWQYGDFTQDDATEFGYQSK